MSLRIVRLGSARLPNEGLRIGTVRRPPRGVRKEHYARENWFDVWYPDLAPTLELMAQAKAAETDKDWRRFVQAFRRQLSQSTAHHALDLLAALSHTAQLSLGCYCENEARCHRSVLRDLLAERGARLA